MPRRRPHLKPMRLTRAEREIERQLARGEWVRGSAEVEAKIRASLEHWRKDTVISIRLNSQDLAGIKAKAAKMGVPYQTLISELIHIYAV